MIKVLLGIPAQDVNLIIDKEFEDEEMPWYDFALCYKDGEYYFEFETMLRFEAGARMWIVHCLSMLTNYMDRNEYNITKELSLFDVFTTGINVNSKFETIEDAYAFLKLMVFGFHGDGM